MQICDWCLCTEFTNQSSFSMKGRIMSCINLIFIRKYNFFIFYQHRPKRLISMFYGKLWKTNSLAHKRYILRLSRATQVVNYIWIVFKRFLYHRYLLPQLLFKIQFYHSSFINSTVLCDFQSYYFNRKTPETFRPPGSSYINHIITHLWKCQKVLFLLEYSRPLKLKFTSPHNCSTSCKRIP